MPNLSIFFNAAEIKSPTISSQVGGSAVYFGRVSEQISFIAGDLYIKGLRNTAKFPQK